MSFDPSPVARPDAVRSLPRVGVARIDRRRLRRAIAALPPLERTVIRLRYALEGREYAPEEVAWMLRLPQRRVEAIERRALRRLRGELTDRAVAA